MRVMKVSDVAEHTGSGYPEPYRQAVMGRRARRIGAASGVTQFGVNIITVPPGVWSSQRHWHSHEDELVLMLTGELTLVTNAGRQVLREGDFVGFPAGNGDGHHLINESAAEASFLVVGSDLPETDVVDYPDIDMRLPPSGAGKPNRFTRKSGEPY